MLPLMGTSAVYWSLVTESVTSLLSASNHAKLRRTRSRVIRRVAVAVAFGQASKMPTPLLRVLVGCLLTLAAGNTAMAAQRGISRSSVYRQVSVLAELGRKLFFDPRLSSSGQLSCASCHDPAHAYGSAHGSLGRGGWQGHAAGGVARRPLAQIRSGDAAL